MEEREAEVLEVGKEGHDCSCREGAFDDASCLAEHGRRWSGRNKVRRSQGECLSPRGRAIAGAKPWRRDAGSTATLSQGHARSDLVP